MKRAIINVSIRAPYTRYQKRLIETCKATNPNVDLITWTDQLPPDARTHHESMYGFKMWAFNHAFEQGYESVLWLDSPSIVHGDLSPIFDIIERDGDFVITTHCKLYQYTNDKTIEHFKLTRKEVKEKQWELNYGFIFGLRHDSPVYNEMMYCENIDLFSSAYEDEQDHIHNSNKLFNGEYVEHRHEESIISMIIQRNGRQLLRGPELNGLVTFLKD